MTCKVKSTGKRRSWYMYKYIMYLSHVEPSAPETGTNTDETPEQKSKWNILVTMVPQSQVHANTNTLPLKEYNTFIYSPYLLQGDYQQEFNSVCLLIVYTYLKLYLLQGDYQQEFNSVCLLIVYTYLKILLPWMS